MAGSFEEVVGGVVVVLVGLIGVVCLVEHLVSVHGHSNDYAPERKRNITHFFRFRHAF